MMTSTTTWAKKTKKKTKKLKELSLLERKEKNFKQRIKATSFVFFGQCVCVFSKSRWWSKPEGFVHRSVPTDEGAGGEEEGPEDGEAQADTTTGGVHTEHGQGGDQVEEQCARADWSSIKEGKKGDTESRRMKGSGRRVSITAVFVAYMWTTTQPSLLERKNTTCKDLADAILRHLLLPFSYCWV